VAAGREGQRVVFTLSRDAAPARLGRLARASADTVLKPTGPGLWYVHAWQKPRWSNGVHIASLPVEVLPSSLFAADVSPVSDSEWGGAPILVRFSPQRGPNLDMSTLSVRVNGATVDTASPAVSYSYFDRLLTLDLRRAPVTFRDGERIAVRLRAADTNGARVDRRWTYRMRHSLDRSGPLIVRVVDYPLHNTFDETLAPCGNLWGDSGAALTLESGSGAGGRSSMSATNLALGGPSGVALYRGAFSAGRFPLLSFDYRIPKTYHLDLVVDHLGRWRNIRLADRDGAGGALGKVAGATADGRWRHAEVNLASLLRADAAAAQTPNLLDLYSLLLVDSGYQGVGPNMTFQVDNLELAPAVSGSAGVRLRLAASDPSGISEIRYHWSAQRESPVRAALAGAPAEHTFAGVGEGERYFHLAAADANGHVSETRHYRFLVDNTAPRWGAPRPSPGAGSGSATISIPLTDRGSGVDVSTIMLHVNGRPFGADSEALTYDANAGRLTWDWRKAPGLEPIADGTDVVCVADPVRDFAGNVGERKEWRWRMEHSRDWSPPSAPSIRSPAHRVFVSETFEESMGGWYLRTPGTYSSIVTRFARRQSSQGWCVRVHDLRRAELIAVACTQAYDLDAHPIVVFEYRAPGEADADWIFQINGRPCHVRMAESGAGPECIGRVPNIVCDNGWHWAWFDLGELVRKALPELTEPRVEMVALGTFNLETQTTRKQLFIDNFMILGSGPGRPEFQWSSRDVTGIETYAYQADRKPNTIPSHAGTKTESASATLGPLEPGMWYVHCRARDNAGRWSRAAHYPYHVRGGGG